MTTLGILAILGNYGILIIVNHKLQCQDGTIMTIIILYQHNLYYLDNVDHHHLYIYKVMYGSALFGTDWHAL